MSGQALRALRGAPALLFVVSLFLLSHFAVREASAQTTAQQNRVVGEVTATNPASGQLTVKTADADAVTVQTNERTSFRRIPPGETAPDKATKVEFASITVGERVVVYNNASQDGTPASAKTIYVTSKAAASSPEQAERERARRLVGRISALNPSKKEITVESRTREGAVAVTILASGNVRYLRYAPDSMNVSDAKPASFAELRVGDQIRARGERSSDGTRFTLEEIVAGSFARTGGTVTAINAGTNEVTIKNAQTGKLLTVVISGKSMLRRITPEAAAAFASRRERGRGEGRPADGAGANRQQGNQTSTGGGEGGRQRGNGQRAGGRNPQAMFESLPAITLADLKQGDSVFVIGSTSDNQSSMTAITLVTGDAEFLQRLQRGPGRDGRGPNNPGLPGDVMGGGSDNREP